MRVILKDKKVIEEQEQRTDKMIKKYKDYLNAIDDQVFEKRGVHLLRPQLAYIVLSVEKAWFMNRDKSTEELLTLMTVAGVKAACEMFCIDVPDEVEIDENFKVTIEEIC